MKQKKPVLVISLLLLCAVAAFCIYKLVVGTEAYREERKNHDLLLEEYGPNEKSSISDANSQQSERELLEEMSGLDVENPSIIKLCSDYPDAVGWLTVPNTKVDYPVVISKDNFDYLHADLNGNYLYAGTPFIGCQYSRDFSSQNTVIYGHNIRYYGTMFNSLDRFKDKNFFNENTVAYIYLPGRTLALDIFAFVIVDAVTEEHIYNRELQEDYLQHVKEKALHYRDITLTENTHIVTLSTCTYEFSDARMALLCTIRDTSCK